MGFLSIFCKGEPQEVPSHAPSGQDERRSPYSRQYETIIAQGHERPTPTFGAPTLIWHVGIWPRPARMEAGRQHDTCDPHDTAGNEHKVARQKFELRRHAWITQVNRRLEALETHGRWRRQEGMPARPKRFEPNLPPKPNLRFWEPADRIDAGSIAMTLWWKDSRDVEQAETAAMRVRFHCELTADHVTFTFYMDVAQMWGGQAGASGRRRAEILEAVENVRRVCQSQLVAAAPDQHPQADAPPLPELLPEGGDQQLMHARNLLYVSVWEDFARDMQCSLAELAGERGEVFANFRGLVLATDGLPDASVGVPIAGNRFPRFSADHKFDDDGPEANAVLKAYWPFIRRITPGADYREFVACGVLSWRAIYVSALGASSQWDPGEERTASESDKTERDIGVRDEVLAGSVEATRTDDNSVWRRAYRVGNNHPVRYLILTKHQPNPRQIGRIAERINAMGTLRLYALKDWTAIKEADTYIRILGQELDKITRDWSDRRRLIEDLQTLRDFVAAKRQERYSPIRRYLNKVFLPGVVTRMLRRLRAFVLSLLTFWELKQLLRKDEQNAVLDTKYALLYEVSSELETQLIAIGAALDEIGSRTVGGLHFRVNRSGYHVDAFRRLLDTLEVRNIPTWVSYEQFVKRGLEPAFEYIASVGSRVRSLRDRLQTVSETIETSALVGQSAATRYNTAVLRQATTIMVAVLAIYLSKLAFPTVYTRLLEWISEEAPRWGRYLWEFATQAIEQGGWLGAVGLLGAGVLLVVIQKALRQ